MVHRRIDVASDRERLLEMHCEINFACEPAWVRADGYRPYRERWLATDQPEAFLADVEQSLTDPRTLALILEDPPGTVAAYLWVRFTDVQGYDVTIAEIDDLWVAPERRRQGIATALVPFIAAEARRLGAACLRSGTGAENTPSHRLHERSGFALSRKEYELRL